MSNEPKLEQLRKEISTSKMLSDHEKADWLNLLELMNDKQIGELEDILQSESAGAHSASKSSLPEKPKSLPLTHISNVPSNISFDKPLKMPMARPQQQVASAQAQGLSAAVASAVPPAFPQFQNAATPSDGSELTPVSTPLRDLISSAKKTSSSGGVSAETVIESPKPKERDPLKLDDLQDVANLDLTIFRTSDSSLILSLFHKLVKRYGYFQVLQNFESSKLYKSYLTKGKNMLAGESTEGKFTVSQEEFELIADILQSMRFNRE